MGFKLFLFSTLVFVQTALGQVQRPPQFINLSFDGSKSPNMWQQTLSFAQQNDIKFTYFVSSVYFIDNSQRNKYVLQGVGTGRSAIGFGGSSADIQNRIGWMETAMQNGHEIAGHGNGHFDGSSWSLEQWMSEFSQFMHFMFDAPYIYGGLRNERLWQSAIASSSMGFRAPQLGKNQNMYNAMRQNRYKYDASKILSADRWPTLDAYGIWEFPLAGLRLNRSGVTTASMDYNIYMAQSGAQPGNPDMFQNWEDEMFETYINYFRSNYYGNRAPLDIGHHFSLWNGGIYWNAMRRFAQTVCRLPEVICGTYQDSLRFLQSRTAAEISAYQAGQFPKFNQQVPLPAVIQRSGLGSVQLSEAELRELQEKSICTPEAHNESDDLPGFEI